MLQKMRVTMVQKIHLIPDRYHLIDVGQLNDGNNYWIDVQLSSEAMDTRDFVATYIFDNARKLIDSDIIDLGLRSDPNALQARDVIKQQKSRIGVGRAGIFGRKRESFWVQPFSVEAHGLVFGLVVREPEEDDVEMPPMVDALPGWTLVFYPPWEDGQYDT